MITLFTRARILIAAAFAFLLPQRLATSRGAGFMEYALLAALAAVIFAVLVVAFPALMNTILDRIKAAVTGAKF